MPEIGKIAGMDWSEAAAAGVTKVLSERVLAGVPFIGNSTIQSGVVKGILAYLVGTQAHHSTIVKGAAIGLTVDAVEDIVVALMGGGSGNAQSNEVRV